MAEQGRALPGYVRKEFDEYRNQLQPISRGDVVLFVEKRLFMAVFGVGNFNTVKAFVPR